VISSTAAPEWLQQSWVSANQLGVDALSMEEIDAEIAAARKTRRDGVQMIANNCFSN
jgi:hypothetical protein